MEASMQLRINEFVNDVQLVSPEQAEAIESTRRLFNKASQALAEEMKYGGIVFLKSGSLIGGIFSYKNHISIEFSNGADFSDPQGFLEGKGKRRRHLKIHNHQEIDLKNAAFFIGLSVSESTDG